MLLGLSELLKRYVSCGVLSSICEEFRKYATIAYLGILACPRLPESTRQTNRDLYVFVPAYRAL